MKDFTPTHVYADTGERVRISPHPWERNGFLFTVSASGKMRWIPRDKLTALNGICSHGEVRDNCATCDAAPDPFEGAGDDSADTFEDVQAEREHDQHVNNCYICGTNAAHRVTGAKWGKSLAASHDVLMAAVMEVLSKPSETTSTTKGILSKALSESTAALKNFQP